MKCPADNTKLKEIKIKDIQLDMCDACRGMWFDKGELEAVIKKRRKQGGGRAEGTPVAESVPGSCPRCSGALQLTESKTKPSVSALQCKKCKGVWVSGKTVSALEVKQKGKSDAASAFGLALAAGAVGTAIGVAAAGSVSDKTAEKVRKVTDGTSPGLDGVGEGVADVAGLIGDGADIAGGLADAAPDAFGAVADAASSFMEAAPDAASGIVEAASGVLEGAPDLAEVASGIMEGVFGILGALGD